MQELHRIAGITKGYPKILDLPRVISLKWHFQIDTGDHLANRWLHTTTREDETEKALGLRESKLFKTEKL
jgi:hypothetical protein